MYLALMSTLRLSFSSYTTTVFFLSFRTVLPTKLHASCQASIIVHWSIVSGSFLVRDLIFNIMFLFVCSSRRVLQGLSCTRRRTCSCRSLPSAGDRRRLSLRETAGKRSVRTPLRCCGRAVSHHATAVTACLFGFVVARGFLCPLVVFLPYNRRWITCPTSRYAIVLRSRPVRSFSRHTRVTVVAYSQPHTTRLLRQQQLTLMCLLLLFPLNPRASEPTASLPVWRFRGSHWKL